MFGVVLASTSSAAELVGSPALAGQSFGQQSDASTMPAYSQAFVAPLGAVVEAIRWWGFHGQNSMGAGFDNFVVLLDGVVQTGALTVTSSSPFFDEYTLDIPDAALTASTLSVINDSLDVEWFWQSAPAVGNPAAPDAEAVSFSLIGHIDAFEVPAPPSHHVAFAALVALAICRGRYSGKRPNGPTFSHPHNQGVFGRA